MDTTDLAQQALASANAAGKPMGADVASALNSLQNVIERNANELDRIKEQMKLQRDSLKNIFENDSELEAAEEEAKATVQKVKEKKSKLQSSPEVTKLKADISDLQDQKKEIEEALNNHLLNLYKITGTAMFDTSSGEQREFVVRASLKGVRKVLQNEE